jgi:hypothetical protein
MNESLPEVPVAWRVALWGMLAGKFLSGWGVHWDIEWHVRIGRDSFWIAPHLMTYAGVSVVVLLSFGVLGWETIGRLRHGRRDDPRAITLAGLSGTRGYHLAAWGVALTVLAAPIDDLWHRLFGLDVTIWSPPHLLGFLGGAVNSLGVVVIALEVYRARPGVRAAAVTLAAAALFGTLSFVIRPGMLLAYQHGGLAFHAPAMLGALLLPLALVGPARAAGLRVLPIFVILVSLMSGLVADQIAATGFTVLKPVSVIDEAIAKDPASPIALANAIGKRSGPPPWPARLAALVPVAILVLADPRRRPVSGTMAWATAAFALTGWLLGQSPAFRELAPGVPETLIALGLTLAFALVSGVMASHLGDRLAALARARATSAANAGAARTGVGVVRVG